MNAPDRDARPARRTGARALHQLPWRYRAVLTMLPAHVRHEHARELLHDLVDAPDAPTWGELLGDVLRAAPGAHWDVMRQDLRGAVRQLQRSPLFAAVAVLTLSLGLGGNLAFFTLVDGVLFQPLPIAGSERLVDITEENLPGGMRTFGMSPANFRDYTRDSTLFAAAGAYQSRSGTLATGDVQQRVVTTSVSGAFFQVFREQAALGRTLLPSDDVVGSNAVVVSDVFHRSALGGDPNVIGREITIDGQSLRIVGVMAPGFAFPSPNVSFWRPLAMPESEWERRGARFVSAVARLRSGVTVARASTALSREAETLASTYPSTNTDWTVLLRTVRDARVDDARSQLYLVWAAGTLVLLVAVANVAGLFLARAITRGREFALRTALGARAARVARQVTTEALLLTVLGTVIGLALAYYILQGIRAAGAQALPRIDEVALGARSIAFAAALAVVTGAVLGLFAVPAVRARDVWHALGSGRGGVSRTRWRLHRSIVAAEVAFAVFILIGASLVARTLWMLVHQPLGYVSANVATFRIEPPFRVDANLPLPELLPALERDRRRVEGGYRSLLDRLQRLPGVQSAGAINRLPLTGNYWVTSVKVPEHPSTDTEGRYQSWIRPVTTGYLETMGTRVVRGRSFTANDAADGERVVVIDQTLAQKVWGGADPIGGSIQLDGPPDHDNSARVVGVAESVHMNRLDAEPVGAVYVPMGQSMEGFFPNWGMDIVVRGPAVAQLGPDFRRQARLEFPDAVAFGEATMDALVTDSLQERRFHLLVLGMFSALALLLTTVGVGGALMLVVRERRGELAVRIALGASRSRVWWDVERGGLAVTLLGVAAGTAGALAGARLFESLVYGIDVRDPLSFMVAPSVLVVAAFAAVAIPATRAIGVNPSAVLRDA